MNDDTGRYKDIDLEYFRKHMTPELYKAFVDNIGVIKGSPGLDIAKLVEGEWQDRHGGWNDGM